MVWAIPPGENKKIRSDKQDAWVKEIWVEGAQTGTLTGRPHSLKHSHGSQNTFIVSSAEWTSAIIQRRHAEHAAEMQRKMKQERTDGLPRALVKQIEEVDMPLDDKVGYAHESLSRFHLNFEHPDNDHVDLGERQGFAHKHPRQKASGEPQGILLHRLKAWNAEDALPHFNEQAGQSQETRANKGIFCIDRSPWICKVSNGRVFYCNRATKETTWSHPALALLGTSNTRPEAV